MVLSVPVSGYSTQAPISLDVAAIINNRRIDFWFAAQFNSIENPESSNPLKIFEELDQAAKTVGLRSNKARTMTDNLRLWVYKWRESELITEDQQARALQAIKTSFGDGGLEPRVFHLSEVVGAVQETEPDEYRVKNQSIDAPFVRQILPPKPR